jgi:hypothetical protein
LELRAAVLDSIANFQLSQSELEWTTIAFAQYVNGNSWTNRFSKATTFDELAWELMSRPLHSSSCGGVHRLDALSQLLAADARRHLFLSDTRVAIIDYLRDALNALRRTQSSSGFWSADWCDVLDTARGARALPRLDTGYARLLVTGHIVEWCKALPPEVAVPTEPLSRSRRWLRSQFASKSSFWDSFCPITHGLLALAD